MGDTGNGAQGLIHAKYCALPQGYIPSLEKKFLIHSAFRDSYHFARFQQTPLLSDEVAES